MINKLSHRVHEMREELTQFDTVTLVQNCKLSMGNDQFDMQIWGEPVYITFPDFIVCCANTHHEPDPLTQALVMYYLVTSDGTPLANKWISFTDLPNGRFYTKAFQGYTGNELALAFGNNIDDFTETAVNCGGNLVDFGDAAFRFQALPQVPILAVCWQGDEEFPPSYKILFDAHVGHHLPTDVCAILGSMLTRRLLQ